MYAYVHAEETFHYDDIEPNDEFHVFPPLCEGDIITEIYDDCKCIWQNYMCIREPAGYL